MPYYSSRKASTLTGGTGDVNPQLLRQLCSVSAAAAGVTTTVAMPVQRLPQSGRAQVMEVLKVYITADTSALLGSTTLMKQLRFMLLTKNPGSTSAPAASDPSAICVHHFPLTYTDATHSGTTGGTMVYDCTDGSGHGILVGSNNLYMHTLCDTASGPSILAYILYR